MDSGIKSVHHSSLQQIICQSGPKDGLDQLEFWDFANPLKHRWQRSLRLQWPRSPGVYLFFDEDDRLLYVGKALDLRARLSSYRHLKRETCSRKIWRLVHRVRSLRWEVCNTEQNALLRENFLLRQFTPPFNTVNSAPKSYRYLGIGFNSRGEWRVAANVDPRLPWEEGIKEDFFEEHAASGDVTWRWFGAFTNLHMFHRAYQSLQRCAWRLDTLEARSLPRSFRDRKGRGECWFQNIEHGRAVISWLSGESSSLPDAWKKLLDSHPDEDAAEDLAILEKFRDRVLERWRTGPLADAGYRPAILVEGDDARGIDVAYLSRLESGEIKKFK